MTFPKIIWQTYKSGDVPSPALACIESWKTKNPGWRYAFFDDDAIDHYVRVHFSAEAYEAFCCLPLAVMKADFWRYAVILREGGVYTDIDTMCVKPIRDWPDNGKGLLVGVSDHGHFCQWTIAARPGHPVLKTTFDLMVERIRSGIDLVYEHFVHYCTGPMVYTDAIRTYLGADEDHVPVDQWGYPDDERRIMTAERLCNAPELWIDRDISVHSNSLFHTDAVRHINANGIWRDRDDYDSWLVLRDALNEAARQNAIKPHGSPANESS